MIGSLIVGALIGMMAGAITKKGESMGCVYNISAGLVGSFVGQSLFGYWGPTLADMAILPSVLGAIIVIAVVDLFFG
ncbi:GlsB/YeaQ/YmgE family stress response membrane protein [Streptococcus equinus]|uniref:GlsB/YeaQ/YmgE family stress response membrane protein n=1 Tax=Streptococcus equinus TaxID=1335 RepID=UPI003BF90253